MKLSLLKFGIITITSTTSVIAGILDTFSEGPFVLTKDGQQTAQSVIISPIGNYRSAGLTRRFLTPETVIGSELALDTGSLYFYASGQTTTSMPLALYISYTRGFEPGGPYSLAEYTGFVFDFSSVEGAGALLIEFGTGGGAQDGHRIPILTSGSLYVPFDQANYTGSNSFDSFYNLHFTFEAVGESFSFTLNEIGLVQIPEPANCGLLVGSIGLCYMACRRRHQSNSL